MRSASTLRLGDSRQICGGLNATSLYYRCTRISAKNNEFSAAASEVALELNSTDSDFKVAFTNGNHDCFCSASTDPCGCLTLRRSGAAFEARLACSSANLVVIVDGFMARFRLAFSTNMLSFRSSILACNSADGLFM